MAEDLAAGHHLIGDAAEAQGDLDARMAWVFARRAGAIGQSVKVVIATDEVVRDAQDGGAELAVAVADQGAVGLIYLIALITRWTQARATGDGPCVGIVGDRSHLTREVGGADGIDAGEGREQD